MNNANTSLIVAGVNGRMGRCTLQAITEDKSIQLIGAFGRPEADYAGQTVKQLTGISNGNGKEIIVKDSLTNCLTELNIKPDVLLDFTEANSALEHSLAAINKGIKPIIGASGLTDKHLQELKEASTKAKVGVLVVPNFSVGAILLINFAKQASHFFQNAEIVEIHKLGKLDAPSGTAMHTARVLSEAAAERNAKYNQCTTKEHELLPGARGGKTESGIHVHSLRLPGILSKQDVLFAGEGELLTLRHESHNTKCFEQGIVLAIKAMKEINSFVLGLDSIIEKQLGK